MSRPRARRGLLAGTFLAGLLLRPAAALAQCAMCSTSVGASRVGRGIAVSVLFLLATLALVVLWIVFLAVRAHLREARRAPAEE